MFEHYQQPESGAPPWPWLLRQMPLPLLAHCAIVIRHGLHGTTAMFGDHMVTMHAVMVLQALAYWDVE